MKVSYKKLWKLLIDRDMTQSQLKELTGISSGSMTKMRKGESVSLNILGKICEVLNCDIGDIISFKEH